MNTHRLALSTRLLATTAFLVAHLVAPAAAKTFVDVTGDSGLDDTGGANGVAFRDLDGDGDLDLAVAMRHQGFRVYRNKGDLRFTEILHGESAYTRSVIWGDYDGDGDEDLLVVAAQRVRLYQNNGGDLTEVGAQVGLDDPALTNTEGAGWLDYDADGDLDLVIDDHGDTELLRNDGGVFAVIDGDDNSAKGFQDVQTGDYLAVADFDIDGAVDILARKGEFEAFADIFRNTGGRGPTPFAPFVLPGAHSRNDGKGGLAFADADADGDFDLIYSGAERNRLFFNQGEFVVDGTESALPGFDPDARTHSLAGVAWGDANGDGRFDLFMANQTGRNLLWINDGGGRFSDFSEVAGVAGHADDASRGCAFADVDRDGDLDLFVANDGGPNRLYRNDTPQQRRPVAVNIIQNGRPALGAVVQFFAANDGLGDIDGDGQVERFDADGDGLPEAVEGLTGAAGETLVDRLSDRGDPIVTTEISGGEGLGGQGVAQPYVYLPAAIPLTVRVTFPGGRVVLRDLRAGDLPNGLMTIFYEDPSEDGDGLTLAQEEALGTSPTDLDSDDDGLLDSQEDRNRNGVLDPGETNPINPDTDRDGLVDGLELGVTGGIPDPDGAGPLRGSAFEVTDLDPSTTTDPLDPDTDGGTALDGDEDANQNGRVDDGERDPLDPTDDLLPIRQLSFLKQVEDADGGSVLPGDLLRYRMEVRNSGTTALTGISVIDDVPATASGLQVESMPAGAANESTSGGANGRGQLRITGFDLASGATAEVVFTTRIDARLVGGTFIVNQAQARLGDGSEPVLSDGEPLQPGIQPTRIQVTANVVLEATKDAIVDGGENPEPGDFVTYVIVVQNTGSAAAQNVQIVDPIPDLALYAPGTIQVNGTPQTDVRDGDAADFGASAPGAVTVALRELAPGGVVTVNFQVQVDPNLTEAGTIVNRATVTAFDVDPVMTGDGPTETQTDPPGGSGDGDPPDDILPDQNPVTGDEVTIRFDFPEGPVQLSIFNLVGELVRDFRGLPAQGQVVWRLDNLVGRGIANGTYIVVGRGGDHVKQSKLVVIR